jgi:hypothetical protein
MNGPLEDRLPASGCPAASTAPSGIRRHERYHQPFSRRYGVARSDTRGCPGNAGRPSTSAQPRTSHGIADHEWRCWPLHKNAMAELAHIGMCGRVRTDRQFAYAIMAERHNVPSRATLAAVLMGTARYRSSPLCVHRGLAGLRARYAWQAAGLPAVSLGSSGSADYVGGGDAGGVAVQRQPGAVIPHRVARVSMRCPASWTSALRRPVLRDEDVAQGVSARSSWPTGAARPLRTGAQAARHGSRGHRGDHTPAGSPAPVTRWRERAMTVVIWAGPDRS